MGELQAVISLLEATAHLDDTLRILADSQYVINCCTRWIPTWKSRGWRKADNKPVLNLDMMKALDELLTDRKVTFQWVRGHTGNPMNEKADELARAAATAFQQGMPLRSGPGFSKVAKSRDSKGSDINAVDVDEILAVADNTVDNTIEDSDNTLPLQPDLGIPLGPMDTGTKPQGTDTTSMETTTTVRSDNTSLIVDITELTRELMSDEVQLDRDRLADLMHPEFVAHLPEGIIRTKGSIIARPAALSGTVHLDVYGADLLGEDAILLRYRMKRNSQDYLCAILWQRTGREWQARFHQMTAVT
jgi:ribonuclease HI